MAKKSRRKRSASKGVKSIQPASVVTTAKAADVLSTDVEGPVTNGADFAADYVYVYKDLRIIMAITALMIVVMVGLSFVI